MSTRAQIKIEKTPILVYQHGDGYPAGVLDTLLPFMAEFMKFRGFDPEYLPARLIQRMCNKADVEHAEMHEMMKKTGMQQEQRPNFLSYGLDCEIHGDIRYLYVVKEDGSVEVQRVDGFGDRQSFVSIGVFKVGTPVDEALKALGEDGT